MVDPERFDPRKHSSVVLNYNEKLPGVSLLIKSAELPVQTFVVGPHVRSSSSSGTRSRPSSAPAARSRKADECAPRFMDEKGRWIAGQLPEEVRATQSQAITASATVTAEVVNSMMPKKRGLVRPVSAVHSYADISPIITGEFVRDGGGHATLSYTLGNKATHKPASPRSAAGSILDGPRPRTPNLQVQVPRTPSGNKPPHPFSPPAGVVSPKTPQQRPMSAPHSRGGQRSPGAAAAAKSPKPGGPLLVHMMSRGPSEMAAVSPYTARVHGSARMGSVRTSTRTGAVPQHTGQWTSLEPQVDTVLKPGHPGVPLDHPLHMGNGANPYPYEGGQYTLRGGTMVNNYTAGHDAGYGAVQQQVHYTNGAPAAAAVGVNASGPYAAAASNAYWPAPSPNSLGKEDLERINELGRGVVPGSANSRLVGGRWRTVPRPTEGDVVYTDYYGPYGHDMANYYGRSYHVKAAEFTKNRLVNDGAYQKVGASMMGIQALRDRPGLSMDATLVHGTPEQLGGINQVTARTAYGQLHHIQEYHNLQPDNRAVYATAAH